MPPTTWTPGRVIDVFWWILLGAVVASLVMLVVFALPLVRRLLRLRGEMGRLENRAVEGEALRVRLEALTTDAQLVRQRLENFRPESQ